MSTIESEALRALRIFMPSYGVFVILRLHLGLSVACCRFFSPNVQNIPVRGTLGNICDSSIPAKTSADLQKPRSQIAGSR